MTTDPAHDPLDLSPVVDAAREGDEQAFCALYRVLQPGMLRYLRGLVGDEAEDVASEAWLQIARDLRSYRGVGSGFRGWAVSIARHRAVDHLRRHRRRPVVAVPFNELVELAGGDAAADGAIESLSTEAAIELIATLPRDQAEAILLRVVAGLDADAAAKVLGKRAGAVRTAAWRGLRRLATVLETQPLVERPSRTRQDPTSSGERPVAAGE